MIAGDLATIDRYTAQYAYSDIHNMQSNVQVHEIVYADPTAGMTVDLPPKTNHAFAYDYSGEGPHRAKRIGDTNLVYDRNGNTLRECRDQGDPACLVNSDHLRRYVWTEENRLEQVIDGGGRNITRFVYDAGGDRVVKLGRGGESITLGQFWSLKGRRAATKHVFAGATRVASKLLPPPGWDDPPSVTPVGGNVGDGIPNDTGCVPSDYQPQKCPILPGGDPSVTYLHADDTKVRPETYYYHSDHLGSTSWMTDHNAAVHEHVEYFPYGEVWRDPRQDADGPAVKGQRFLFTGKELDEETGLYYFGARYYDPLPARWASTDPADRWTASSRTAALNPYQYALWSPARFIDPVGRDEKDTRPAATPDYTKVPPAAAFRTSSSKLPSSTQNDLAEVARTVWILVNYDKIAEARRKAPNVWPVRGPIQINGRFGDVREVRGNRPHTGVDLQNALGADVLASRGGVVERAACRPMCGGASSSIVVQNDDGSRSLYGHTTPSVIQGERIRMGQTIGRSDEGSGVATGPHLHYSIVPVPELSEQGYVDPLPFLPQ